MAAHAQRRRTAGQLDGLIGSRGPGHQRGAGQHSSPVQLKDGAIDPGGQPKIVGIEDETAHGVSVSTGSATTEPDPVGPYSRE